jgi:hypothetical protein
MKLYHGTDSHTARLALEHGLLPREDAEVEGNWENCPSRPDLVYLTDAYAPYFAANTSKPGPDNPWGIIEVETDLLEGVGDLLPDEDFLEQGSRGRAGKSHPPVDASMEDRTQWFRERLAKYAHYWEDSLESLGNCAFRGPIPVCAITRVVLFNPYAGHSILALKSIQPQISILNYKTMGMSYRNLTRWMAGYEVIAQEIDPFIDLIMAKPPAGFEKYVEALERELADTSALTFLKGEP